MSRIESVEVFPVGVRVKSTFTFASGSAGGAGDEVILIYVKIRDDDGVVGWGECRPMRQWSYETPESAVSTIRRHLAPAIIGHDVSDRAGLHARMNAAIGRGTSTGQPIAKSAIDIAIHDLVAKRAGLPLREFLGGARERRDLSISFTITGHDAEEARQQMLAGQADGYRHFNFKAAVQPETDIAVAKALKQTIASGGFLWSDANQGFNITGAKYVARAFEEIGVDILEQPLPADQFTAMRELRRATRIPLAVDEASVSPGDFLNHVAAGLVDYLIIKVTRSGGVWPSLQQIAVAQAAGLPMLVSGLTDGLLTKMAACQLASVFGLDGPVALNGTQFIDEAGLYPAKSGIERGGMIRLNDIPGIGVEPDQDYLKQHARDI
ncbi:mandelate racemase/muconate lactonizing enzyme family protein [Bradyrhizobium canariense]|uniref:Muconate cycloisomerase n=1 Tax=Bradyrhizobium canariense TaxID=255045 RepID=A0A1H1RL05_9BRAD|nr:enolase C-terminal domain-like protein [Bradyrhizobium canariense]SDS36216.1 muconate cycloisomerase [Bradyrhizobium canariense]